ncbi:hypothetical protein [uncultured Clostridium sp.]|uniref:hypothetical protein n=1 Tax=uncultured Clostridium sp. TaxID=59620 RepID=UPI0025DAEC8D|nr:hypothetical protein [uncultured Clostridium sp.]
MKKRLHKKIMYLMNVRDKYNKLNKKTHYKYLYRENAIVHEIEVLQNLENNITGEWYEAYKKI